MDGVKLGRSWRDIKPGERVIETRHEHTQRETLPPEVKLLIEQICATLRDHEERIVITEKFLSALTREAASKLKAAG